MRSLPFVLGSLFLVLGLQLGCGGTSKDPVATAGTSSSSAGTAAEGGTSTAGTGVGGSAAGEATSGGSASSAGTSSGGSGAGGSSGANAGGEGGAASLVDCDARKITCKRTPPTCDTFHVPSVEGSCYGDCVKIDRCACSGPAECPDSNQYTCWSKKHCGPYVN